MDFRIDRGNMRGIEFGGLYEDMRGALNKDVDIMTTKQLDAGCLSTIREEEILLYDRTYETKQLPSGK